MTGSPSVSVVVLNRDRVDGLQRTVAALRQQSYRDFQLVIVTNQPKELDALFPDMDAIACVPFAAANISAARNAGIAASCGEIIAFCDDDAVPEPQWLSRLVAAFENPRIGAVGGTVRGRNGVSIQWGPTEVDCFGNDHKIQGIRSTEPFTAPVTKHRFAKTVGTNCAFRRAALKEVGGFDCAYHFYLDETDLNLRISRAGWRTAIVPLAEVHHGFAESIYRTRDRIPKTLFEIGASKSYFCKRHGMSDDVADQMDAFRNRQRQRLVRLMLLGHLAGKEIDALMASLDAGIAAGTDRHPEFREFGAPPDGQRFPSGPAPQQTVLNTGFISRSRIMVEASELATNGQSVTVMDFTPSTRMLRVRFVLPGIWVHRGGSFGRTDRNDLMFAIRTRAKAACRERSRICQQRDFMVKP